MEPVGRLHGSGNQGVEASVSPAAIPPSHQLGTVLISSPELQGLSSLNVSKGHILLVGGMVVPDLPRVIRMDDDALLHGALRGLDTEPSLDLAFHIAVLMPHTHCLGVGAIDHGWEHS